MKKTYCLFVLILFSFFVFTPAQAQNQALQACVNANMLYTQKNYDAAIANYQTAVQLSPRFWQAYQGMGNCYYAKGDHASALACYQRSLTLNPDNTKLAQFVQSIKPTPAPSVESEPMSPSVGTSAFQDNASSLSDGRNPNLPKKDRFVFEIEDSDWTGSWNDLETYYENQITSTSTIYDDKLGLGAAYALSPYFQLGLKGQFILKSPQVISASGETITYSENALGGAIEGEGVFPMSDGVNFISGLQVGLYTLVGTNVVGSGPINGQANFSDTEPGLMITAAIELVMNSNKTWALDLGLDYQYLKFSNLSDTPIVAGQISNSFILKNPDGSNAYFDFSGFGIELEARFF